MARGFTQIFVDYDDTYAPVAKLASSRVIPAIAAAEDLELEQMDVVAAFGWMISSLRGNGWKILKC